MKLRRAKTSIKEWCEAFKRWAYFPRIKLDYWTLRKLRSLKSKQTPNKSWAEWFKYLTQDTQLSPTLHERIQEGTARTLLATWMQNYADNLPYIRYGDDIQIQIPQNYRQQTFADLVRPDPMLETEAEYPKAEGPIEEHEGVKVKNPPVGSAVVIGRGPSLFRHGHLDMLAEAIRKDEYTGIIVASDGALTPCLDAGVLPDAVVTVDGAPIIKKYFEHPLLTEHGHKIKWIVTVTVSHEVYQQARKNKMPVYWFNPIFDDWRQNESWTRLQVLMSRTNEFPRGVPRAQAGGNCLIKGTLLLGNSHTFPIEDALIGEYVWSFNPVTSQAEKTRVTNIIPQGIVNVYELTTRTRRIKATMEHRFLCLEKYKEKYARLSSEGRLQIKRQRKKMKISRSQILESCGINSIHTYKGILNGRKRIRLVQLRTLLELLQIPFNESFIADTAEKHRRKLSWKILAALRSGDYITILRQEPKSEIHQPYYILDFGFTTDNFMRIIGAFLGDGYIRIRNRSGELHLCLPRNDKSREKYILLLQNVFSKPVREYDNDIVLYSKKIALLLANLGLNKKANKKEIPQWVFSLPASQKMSLVEGLLDTDGYEDKLGMRCFYSSSEKLIRNLKMLLICLGFHVDNIQHRIRHNQIIINQQGKRYQYPQTQSWVVRITTQKKGKRHAHYYRPKFKMPVDFALDRVQKIVYKGKDEVYDIGVEQNNNFVAEGIVCHNSGCFAWIMAMEVFKRAPVALIGIDFGYPEGTKLEETQYYSSVLKMAEGNVAIIKEAYKEFYHPTWKAKAFCDLVFYHYRQAFLELQNETAPWYRLYGGTISCVEGGTLFGQGVKCIPFKEFLTRWQK